MNDWLPLTKVPFQIGSGRRLFAPAGDGEPMKCRYSASRQELEARLFFDAGSEGPPGHVHGGVLCYAIDECMGAVCWAAGLPAMAGELRFHFSKMVTVGKQEFILRTRIAAIEARKIHLRASLFDQQDIELAKAKGLFIRVQRQWLETLLQKQYPGQPITWDLDQFTWPTNSSV